MAKERNGLNYSKYIQHSGSLSLISAIINSGGSFNATVAISINSKLFIDYLKEILSFLIEQQGIMKEKTIILMDNASSHRSKVVMEFLDSCGVCVTFIHTYSKEFAQEEKYFGIRKDLVNRNKTTTVINWKSKERIALIGKCIKRIDLSTIKRVWRIFFR